MSAAISRPQAHTLQTARGGADAQDPAFGDEIRAAVKELTGAAAEGGALPLEREDWSLELSNIGNRLANSLRRALVESVPGACLAPGALEVTENNDDYMDEHFVQKRLSYIPLNAALAGKAGVETLEYELDATNPTTQAMPVYSKDLVPTEATKRWLGGAALFNPTHEVCLLQPAKALRIKQIRVRRGRPQESDAFRLIVRACLVNTDLKTEPTSATHAVDAPLQSQSGYAESTFVSAPRSFKLTGSVIAAPPGAKTAQRLLVAGCEALEQRVGRVRRFLLEGGGEGGAPAAQDIGFQAQRFEKEEGGRLVGELTVQGENATLGGCLVERLNENHPDASFISEKAIPHENCLVVRAALPATTAESLREAFAAALLGIKEDVESIRRQLGR